MAKLPNKMIYVLAGIVAGAAVTLVTTTNAAQIAHRASTPDAVVSSEASVSIVSSTISELVSSGESSPTTSSGIATSSTISIPSIKSPVESAVNAGVSKIHEETDKSISTIHGETQKAVREVQKAVSEPASSKSKPQIQCGKNRISFSTPTVKKQWLSCDKSNSYIDESGKALYISFGGALNSDYSSASGLIANGFALKNASGDNVAAEDSKGTFMKVPYKEIADVSELYLSYEDQSIKITVSK